MALKIFQCECGASFKAQTSARKRGWARSCSKSCAARRRERELNRGQVWTFAGEKVS